MQIIDELEPHKRGSYGGAIGYLGFNGDLDTAIHIRTVVVKDGVVHVQAGGGTVADAKPDYEYRGVACNKAEGGLPGRGAGREPAGVAMSVRVLVIDNYDSFTYNLVQYLGELGAEPEVVRNDKATVAELLRPASRSAGDLAGAVHARRCRDLDRGGARLPRGGRPDAGRLPRPPVPGRGVRRADDPRRADPRQGRRDRARRQGSPARAGQPAARGPLSLAGRRPRAALGARAERDARRRRDGRPPPRAARRRACSSTPSPCSRRRARTSSGTSSATSA